MPVESTGIPEMRAGINQLPAAVTEACRRVAEQTAEREAITARSLVRVDTGITKDSIKVTADVANKQYLVTVGPTPHPGRHGHWSTFVRDFLAVLIEHGTAFISPRPFMRPANDRERERYTRDMEQASAAVVEKALQ